MKLLKHIRKLVLYRSTRNSTVPLHEGSESDKSIKTRSSPLGVVELNPFHLRCHFKPKSVGIPTTNTLSTAMESSILRTNLPV